MKKLLYLFVAAMFIAACSSEPSYVITGNITDGDSSVVVLQKRVGTETVILDSAVVNKGKFTIKGGAVEYPEQVQLIARGKRGSLTFYLENADINITAHIDTLNRAVVTGSVTQDEVAALAESMKPLQARNAELSNQFREAASTGDMAKVEEIRAQIDAISEEAGKLNLDFVKNNTGSFHAPALLRGMVYGMEPAEIESYLNAFTPEVQASKTATDLAERVAIMKTVAVGQKAPDFTLNDPDGNPVSLYSKVGTKLLLVDFWAAWCGPCRMENPHVVKVWQDFNKKGFDVFGVSLDRTKEDWLGAIAEDNLTWTHVSDLQYWNSAAAKLYAVNAIPANFLLDENGIILARNLRGDALLEKVKEVLGN
ncbi:MAG: redoxin domain-containing protein [Bacteroidales bacterium]|nr:redoxin domain-containing protein [Bacteroidales bacterium]